MKPRPTDHRRFVRPSFLPVLGACSGAAQMSHAVVERFGEPEPDDAMDTGLDIHACSMIAFQPAAGRHEPGSSIPRPDIDGALAKFPLLTGWDQACVRRYVDFGMALLAKTRNDYPDEPVEFLVEHDLDGTPLGIDPGGQADLLIVVPWKIVRCVDLKAGFLDQGEAADHDQLASYAVLAAASFKCRTVEAYLFQPRADPANRASGARFEAAELQASMTWTRSVVQDALSDDPELVAGYHCCHCRAVTRCPAAKEFIMRLKEALPKIAEANDPKAWCELIDAAQVAGKFYDGAVEQAKGHIIAGGLVDLWSLKPGQPLRKIDPAQAVALARDKGLLHVLHEHVTIKVSAIEALPCIQPAVTTEPKAPSLARMKASTGAKP